MWKIFFFVGEFCLHPCHEGKVEGQGNVGKRCARKKTFVSLLPSDGRRAQHLLFPPPPLGGGKGEEGEEREKCFCLAPPSLATQGISPPSLAKRGKQGLIVHTNVPMYALSNLPHNLAFSFTFFDGFFFGRFLFGPFFGQWRWEVRKKVFLRRLSSSSSHFPGGGKRKTSALDFFLRVWENWGGGGKKGQKLVSPFSLSSRGFFPPPLNKTGEEKETFFLLSCVGLPALNPLYFPAV